MSERLISIVPENPIAALAEGNILAIIFFAILIGVGLLSVGESGKPVADFMDASSEVVLRITHWIHGNRPIGVLALIARVTGAQGFDALLNAVVLGNHGIDRLCRPPRAHPRGSYHAADAETLPINFFAVLGRLQCWSCFLRHLVQRRCRSPCRLQRTVLGEASGRLNGAAAWRYHQHGWHCFVCWYCVSLRSAGLGVDLTLTDYLIMAGTTTGFGRYGRCAERVPVPDGGGNGEPLA